MKISSLFTDDEAVSPVIGVILMVAITVILAAVIGAFVLNIGGSQEAAPQASIEFTFADDTEATISHEGGEALTESTIDIKVGSSLAYDGSAGNPFENNFGGTASDDASWSDPITAASEVTIDDSTDTSHTDDEIRVVWSSQNSDKTQIIGSSTWSS